MSIKVNGTKKITNLTAATTINDADVFMIETSSGSRKVTGTVLKTLINSLAQTKADGAADGVVDIIGAEFDANESYSAGDYVIYEGKLYKFTADHATGAFDGTDAEEVTVADELSNKVKDVTIDGVSVVVNGVAQIPNVSYPTAITITTPPDLTEYEVGTSFDPTGMEVTLIWSTGETRILLDTEYTISPSVLPNLGTQNVTISYTLTEPYVLTATQQVTVVDIIPDTWEKMVQVSKTGRANEYFSVGDVINDTYTIGTTEYTCPWIVMDFRTVELEDGTTYDNVPIIAMEYTNHENVMFDAAETTEATEETATSGHYYYGYTAEGNVYTALNLSVGDTIPYESYDKVYVTLWNSVNAIRYGTNSWKYSYIRQYMNNSGTGWWQPAHEYDVIPNGYENRLGFKSYISSDMLSVLHPIKIVTKESNYMGGGVDMTYDTFWLPSLSEMNIQNNNIATTDGEPWQYYKELLESDTKVASGTYAVLKRYAVNATTSAQHHWVRSANLGGTTEWYVISSGYTNSGPPPYQYRLAAACAII